MNETSTNDPFRPLDGRKGTGLDWRVVTSAVAAVMAVTQLLQIEYLLLPDGLVKTAHLCFGVLVVSLTVLEKDGRKAFRMLAALSAILSVLGGAYVFYAYDELIGDRAIFANGWDVTFSIVLLIATLFAVWREWGWGIPALALAALLYGYYGYLMPGELLFHGGIPLSRIMSYTAIPFFQGLLGGLTGLSAGVIFVFLFFGAVLAATGGIDFILEVARRCGGSSRAGPAQVAVISSGLMGMISGSTVANIAPTGSITIPMMKRFGFKPHFAGAVEAAASMGGQLTPPVMGLAAFLIVGLTGIPYTEVMVAAIIPAMIYYLYLMIAVHVRATKVQIDPQSVDDSMENPLRGLSWSALLARHLHILLGIALLIVMLMRQMPPRISALYGSLFMLVLDAARTILFSAGSLQERLKAVGRTLYDALAAGGRSGAQVAVILAAIGILVEILTVTGFAQKLSGAMLAIADGRPWLLSMIVAGACMVFGLGLPTPAAYLIVALLGAPALVETGVPILAAHMFVFYFANVSALTPPVAIAALVAANIAKAKFLPTAFASVRLSLPAFLLPFLFLAHPQILGLAGGPMDWIIFGLSALIGVSAINSAIEDFTLIRLGILGRLLMGIGGAAMIVPGLTSTLAGAALIVAVLFVQVVLMRVKRNRDKQGLPVPTAE